MMLRHFIALSILFLPFSANTEDRQAIDSLTARLAENLHDTNRAIILNKLAWKLMYVNTDTAILLSSKALAIAESFEWQSGISASAGKLGTFYDLKSDYPKALEYYFKAFGIAEKLHNKGYMAPILGNIALVYKDQGNYAKAMDFYFQALKIYEELGDNSGIARQFSNMGIVYRIQGDYSKSLKYYFKALNMTDELENKSGSAGTLSNIGLVYEEQGDYAKAMEYFSKSLIMNEEIGRKIGIAINLSNIGGVYDEQGSYLKALEYYFKSLNIAEELESKEGIAINLGTIGALYTRIGEFEKAEESLQKALLLSKEMGAKDFLRSLNESLSILYDTTARPAEAFKAYKLHIIYRDSISNEENTKAQTRTEMKYEYENAELVRQQEEKEVRRKMKEVRQRRDNLQYSVILIAILVLFGGVLSLGFINVSERAAEGIIFFSFLILFEFLLVLADPYIDRWSGGAPGIKLLFNAGIAAFIFPLHSFFETRLKGRLVKS